MRETLWHGLVNQRPNHGVFVEECPQFVADTRRRQFMPRQLTARPFRQLLFVSIDLESIPLSTTEGRAGVHWTLSALGILYISRKASRDSAPVDPPSPPPPTSFAETCTVLPSRRGSSCSRLEANAKLCPSQHSHCAHMCPSPQDTVLDAHHTFPGKALQCGMLVTDGLDQEHIGRRRLHFDTTVPSESLNEETHDGCIVERMREGV